MKEGKIIEWLDSQVPLTKEVFDEYKVLTRKLSSSDQILFLKKVINEVAKGNINLKVSDLLDIKTFSLEAIQEFGEPKELDYTLDLIIYTLSLIDKKGHFPDNFQEVHLLVKDLADFICNYLQNRVEYLIKVNLLFDTCPGRTSIVNRIKGEKYIQLRGNNYKVYNIYQGYSIENRDKTGWGELIQHFRRGIYAKGKVCYLEVIKKEFDKELGEEFITYGKSIEFKGKLYPFEWKSDDNNYLITPDTAPVPCCEGRKSPSICHLSKKKFWWCYGRKCFEANQVDHNITDWKLYSLRDFIKILKLPFDEVGYYTFVSEVNRLNRLLDRLKCESCKHILRPSKQTNFGFYRVSYFQCNNENYNNELCPSYHKEIYLTHCLNSKCTNVIDDRVAKRCPNGFIICDKCGSCCSNDQFERRVDALKANGQSISPRLKNLVFKKEGHWERAECYCYKCQKEMNEGKGGNFVCNDCKIHYDHFTVYIKFHKDYKSTIELKRKIKDANE